MNLKGQVKVKAVLPKFDCASEQHIELMNAAHFRFSKSESPEVKLRNQYFQHVQGIQNHSQV